MRLKFMMMAASAITSLSFFLACSSDNTEVLTPSKFITVDAGVGSLTRATSTEFEKGDKISLYAWTGDNASVSADLIVNNSINTYDGSIWNANPIMLWKDAESVHYFIGVYPTKTITDFTADICETTSDVLVATSLGNGRKAIDGIVPLTFDHVMAKLRVNLTYRSQWNGIPTVSSLVTPANPGAIINYLTKAVVPNGDVTDVTFTATTANLAYECVVAPQTINTINIEIEDKVYTYNNTTGIILEPGKVQVVNLIVGRDQITLGSVTINDWGTGEIINDGEAQEN